MEKAKPPGISTDAANANPARESEVHTVSPISPLFAEETNEPLSAPSQPLPAGVSPTTSGDMETPPPKPPRPISPRTQAQLTLSEAFPTVEVSVIKTVLIASRGQIEPAFEALLAMTDPSFVPEEAAPQQRSHPTRVEPTPRADSRYPPQQTWDAAQEAVAKSTGFATSTPRNQLEADELYARQLAEHYSTTSRPRTVAQAQPQNQLRQHSEDDDYTSEKEHSFLDDDLPMIKENIRQGFLQTQEKVNKWVSELKKRLDGDNPPSEDPPSPPIRSAREGSYNTRGSSRQPRESVYDADPRVISDDFAHLELRDNTREVPPPRPPRPIANPKLFQSTTPSMPASRKVTFEDVGEEELYRRDPPKKTSSPIAGGPSKSTPPPVSKWEPLKVVEPTPLDGDPFSLGDSEDERDRDEAKAANGSTPGESVKSKP